MDMKLETTAGVENFFKDKKEEFEILIQNVLDVRKEKPSSKSILIGVPYVNEGVVEMVKVWTFYGTKDNSYLVMLDKEYKEVI